MVEKRPVRIGLSVLGKPMSKKQAELYAWKVIPKDMKSAGFVPVIFESDEEIHGSLFYRINYAYDSKSLWS